MKFNIGKYEIKLNDIAHGSGYININSNQKNYSYQWGAMGGDIATFMLKIDGEYFANKICNNRFQFDIKNTFKKLRGLLKEDLDMPYYIELEFQKDYRKSVNSFYEEISLYDIGSQEQKFFNDFNWFMNLQLNFSFINDKIKRYEVENYFKEYSTEPHLLIEKKYSDEFKELVKLHAKIQKWIKKNMSSIPTQ